MAPHGFPWRREWLPTPVFLPGESHGCRSLVGCGPWGREESDTTERLRFHFSLSCTGEGNGKPLQCSCLENPRDGGAWWAAIYEVAQSRTRLKRLSSSSSRFKRPTMADKLAAQSCATPLRPHGLQPARFLCPWDSPGKNTGVGSHSLLQGIFLTQGSNPGPPALQANSLPSEPPGKPWQGFELCHNEISKRYLALFQAQKN